MQITNYIDQQKTPWVKITSDEGYTLLIKDSKMDPAVYSKNADIAVYMQYLVESDKPHEVSTIPAMHFCTANGNWYVDVKINNKQYLFVTNTDKSKTLKSIHKNEYFGVLDKCQNTKEKATTISLMRVAECIIHIKNHHAMKNSKVEMQ